MEMLLIFVLGMLLIMAFYALRKDRFEYEHLQHMLKQEEQDRISYERLYRKASINADKFAATVDKQTRDTRRKMLEIIKQRDTALVDNKVHIKEYALLLGKYAKLSEVASNVNQRLKGAQAELKRDRPITFYALMQYTYFDNESGELLLIGDSRSAMLKHVRDIKDDNPGYRDDVVVRAAEHDALSKSETDHWVIYQYESKV